MSIYRRKKPYFWELPKGLPIGKETVIRNFELHNESWVYYAYFCSESDMLCLKLNCISFSDASFNVQFGVMTIGGIKTSFESKAVGATNLFIGMNLISRSTLDLLRMENECTFFFIEIEKAQKRKASKRKLETDYEDLLLSGLHSDVTVEVKHKKFKCHSSILSVQSPVFSAMFSHDMKEKISGIVTIEDAEPETFQDFLIYLYTGSSDNLNWKNVTDLYKLADKYSVDNLKCLCVEQMKSDISTENFREFSYYHNNIMTIN